MNESQVFLNALQLPDERAQREYLDQACGEDARLRAGVEALLLAHNTDPDFLEPPNGLLGEAGGADTSPEVIPHGDAERLGTVLAGRYKLAELIGEGGMGAVWMAEQTEPVKRPVAVKLIKPGMDSKQVLARFEAERQALAMMDHPGIAKVFDAGATVNGRPFFVMELVKGTSLTRYCDENQLSVRERLALFVQVCLAVQHAHQKGIIHRDLKPANILVVMHDDKPVPKVIDFGVAIPIGHQLTESTLVTGLGVVIGTPQYMSPEQAGLDDLDTDTRSDVYALGVLLYELLAGHPPLPREGAGKTGLLETLRAIREDEPPWPSAELSAAAGLPELAARRSTEPARLVRLVRGDLDWIALKALAKERDRRFESANGLASDVRRYLADEPVQACPPVARDRFRKFARRNRRALMTVALTVAGLFATATVVAWSIGWAVRDRAARAAEAERDTERELSDTERLRDRGDWAGARMAVKRVERLLLSDRGDQRERLAQVVKDLDMIDRLEEIALRSPDFPILLGQHLERGKLSSAYTSAFRDYGIDVLGLAPPAAAERIRASAIRTQLVAGLDDWMWTELMKVHYTIIRKTKVPTEYTHLHEVADAVIPNEWSRRIRAATSMQDQSSLKELTARPEVAALPSSNLLLLARILERGGAADKAVEVLRNVQQRNPQDFTMNYELALMLAHRVKPARPDEAAGFMRAAVAARPDIAMLRLFLGHMLKQANQFDSAISAYRKVLEMQPDNKFAQKGIDDALAKQMNGKDLAKKGSDLSAQRKWRDAIAHFSKAIELGAASAEVWHGRGGCYARLGRWTEAADDLAKAVGLMPANGIWRYQLAACLLQTGDTSGYRQTCAEGLVQVPEDKVDNSAYLVSRACGLAPDAVPDPNVPIRLLTRIVAATRTAPHLHALGLAHYRAGEYDQAVNRLEESGKVSAAWDQATCANGFVLAMAHHRQNRPEKARDILKATVARLERGEQEARAPVTFPATLVEWLSCQILRREAEALITSGK